MNLFIFSVSIHSFFSQSKGKNAWKFDNFSFYSDASYCLANFGKNSLNSSSNNVINYHKQFHEISRNINKAAFQLTRFSRAQLHRSSVISDVKTDGLMKSFPFPDRRREHLLQHVITPLEYCPQYKKDLSNDRKVQSVPQLNIDTCVVLGRTCISIF